MWRCVPKRWIPHKQHTHQHVSCRVTWHSTWHPTCHIFLHKKYHKPCYKVRHPVRHPLAETITPPHKPPTSNNTLFTRTRNTVTQTSTTLTPTTFTPVTCVVPPCGWACKCVRGSGPGRSSPLDSRAAPPCVMVNPAYSLNPPSPTGWLAVFDCRCGLWNGPGSWWSSSGSSPGKPPWGAFAQVPNSPPLDTPRGAAAHASGGVFSACNKVVAGCGSPGVVCGVGVRCAATVWVRGCHRNPCRGLRLAHGQR